MGLSAPASKIGLRWRQSFLKISDRASGADVCTSLYLHREYTPRPAMLPRFKRVPMSLIAIVELVQKCHDVGPRQLCNGLLHKIGLRPRQRERTHVLQVTWGKSTHIGKRYLQVPRQSMALSR